MGAVMYTVASLHINGINHIHPLLVTYHTHIYIVAVHGLMAYGFPLPLGLNDLLGGFDELRRGERYTLGDKVSHLGQQHLTPLQG